MTPAALVLELRLDPAALPAFARLSGLRAERAVPTRILWHDRPDDALFRHNLAIAAEGRTWTAEPIVPADTIWLPATPAPILARGQGLEELAERLGLPLSEAAPLAQFEGKRRIWADGNGETAGRIEALYGTLHGAARDLGYCRLRLTGGAPWLHHMLDRLRMLPVRVPRASLAAEAIALAHCRAPAPRRDRAPTALPGCSVGDGFAALFGGLADLLLHAADRVGPPTPEPVHTMRVALRRMRSLLSLFDRALHAETVVPIGDALKQLGRQLGAARDWDVFLHGIGATIGEAQPDESSVAAMLTAAERRRAGLYSRLRAQLAGPAFRALELDLARFTVLRPWANEEKAMLLASPLAGYVQRALNRKAKRITGAADDLDTLSAEDRHRLRKRVKRMRYNVEAVRPLFPGSGAGRTIRRLNRLQDVLGKMNDAHGLPALLAQLGPAGRGFACGLVQGYALHAASADRPAMRKAWRKLRDTDRFWH